MTDAALILRARGGDELAFRRLLDRHRDLIEFKTNWLYAPGLTADDLRQEAHFGFLKAVRDWRPSGGASFRNFAALCIQRQAWTAVKLATTGKHTPLNGADSLDAPAGREPDQQYTLGEVVPDRKADPDAIACNRETLREVSATVWEGMSELERESVLGLAAGKSYKEVAEDQGVPFKAIDNAVQRANRKLAAAVGGEAA